MTRDREEVTFVEAAAMLGVSRQRLTFLWLAGYVDKAGADTLTLRSVRRHEAWRTTASRWRKAVRLLTAPLHML